jgi:hypothetical protein
MPEADKEGKKFYEGVEQKEVRIVILNPLVSNYTLNRFNKIKMMKRSLNSDK